MPFDGSGNFNRVMNWVNDALAGIKVKSDRHDAEDDNFASGLSNCITKDGQTQPTADIPFNGKKLLNVGAPVSATDATTKAYVDAKLDFSTTGVPVPGSGAAASIRFADADVGFGTRKAGSPAGTVNRFVWNDKPDLSGADVATLTEVGNFSVSGTFTTTGEIKGGLLTTAAIVAIKPTSGNGHVWWYAADGTTTRMILYTSSGAQGAGNLTVGGQNFAFGADGQFTAPSNLYAAGARYQTDGNITGSIWNNFGAGDAYTAINNRIETRALAFANDRVAQLQYRKVSQGYSGAATSFVAPAGAVLNGYERDSGPQSGQLRGCYYMFLQVFDPVRGWVGFSG